MNPVEERDEMFVDELRNVENEEQENNNADEQPDNTTGGEEPKTPEAPEDGIAEQPSLEDDEKIVKIQPADSAKDTEDNEVADENEESVQDSESFEEAVKAQKPPKKEVPPDFVYELENFVSRPVVQSDSGIPLDLVSLVHSFGFDALRRNNLQLLENHVICYIVGNYLEIMNLVTFEKRYIRSLSGVGIGAFSVHPERIVIALAEKGDRPMVCIYRYPQLDLYRLLPEGTQKEYSSCDFR